MKSVIEEIYKGKSGDGFIKETDEFWEISDEIAALEMEFENSLNEEQKQMFANLLNKTDEEAHEYAKARFFEGFKQGILLWIEVNG